MTENDFFDLKSDLADETGEILSEKVSDNYGIFTQKRTQNGVDIFISDITTEEGERRSGKKCGKYVTLNVGSTTLYDSESFERVCKVFASVAEEFISPYFGKSGGFLLAGLGNPGLPADSVGAQTVQNFIVTRHLKTSMPDMFEKFGFSETCAMIPDVLGNTGMEAAEIIKGVADDIRPGCIIAVDALSSRHLSRVATTVQICNTGICPGSGVGNARMEISADSMGVPVIAIGVPTVVNATTLLTDALSDCGITPASLTDESKKALMNRINTDCYICPKDCGQSIKSISRLIGYSLNFAIHKGISFSEIHDFL
ncbi:MAG: GPR endopeptidase [Clostridia bacterium]|nr:GPR endopeptidase [Clostridia bacterium]